MLRHHLHPQGLSAAGLIIVLAATIGSSWFVAGQGYNIGEISGSILTSTYPDEVIPRLLIAAAFVWGSYLLIRSGPGRQVLVAAVICAVIGTLTAVYVITRAEIGFAQAFPDDGAAGGWAPGEARARFLPLSYLGASVQASLGLLASTALLVLRRAPA